MIDTHCHLLPALDDGPATELEAVELAHTLVRDGVGTVLCTPHYSRRFPTTTQQARARLERLDAVLHEADLPLQLVLGVEFAPAAALALPLQEVAGRSISRRFVLIEVQPDTPIGFFAAAVDRLDEADLRPIFAHPERSRGVWRHPAALDASREQGALVQVVAPSLVGRWGESVAATAWGLIDKGRADLLASDAHGVRRRRCHLRRAAALIRERLGERVAADLTEHRPSLVLRGIDRD
jgi:protein-tyrosine phosphatase